MYIFPLPPGCSIQSHARLFRSRSLYLTPHPDMSDLPLHSQITIWILYGSALTCILLVLFGMLRQRLMTTTPPVPQFPGSSFPHVYAYVYSIILVLIFLFSTVSNVRSTESDSRDPAVLITAMMVQVVLYLPCICMYFSLPRRLTPAASLPIKFWWVCKALFIIWGNFHICNFTIFA